jgi:hypothetical protein
MIPDDAAFKKFSKGFTRYGFGGGFNVYHLGQPIHKDNNGIISPCRGGEISDKIKGNGLPTAVRNGQRVKGARHTLPRRFGALARVAVLDETFDRG